MGALVCALGAGAGVPVAYAADLVVGQVAPLSGVLASTGAQMVLGARSTLTGSMPTAGCMAPPSARTWWTTRTR